MISFNSLYLDVYIMFPPLPHFTSFEGFSDFMQALCTSSFMCTTFQPFFRMVFYPILQVFHFIILLKRTIKFKQCKRFNGFLLPRNHLFKFIYFHKLYCITLSAIKFHFKVNLEKFVHDFEAS